MPHFVRISREVNESSSTRECVLICVHVCWFTILQTCWRHHAPDDRVVKGWWQTKWCCRPQCLVFPKTHLVSSVESIFSIYPKKQRVMYDVAVFADVFAVCACECKNDTFLYVTLHISLRRWKVGIAWMKFFRRRLSSLRCATTRRKNT